MNKKGQLEMGGILVVFIVVLVGAILLVASAQQVGETTNTRFVTNATLESDNGTSSLEGKFVTDFVAYNGSTAFLIGASNFTIVNNQVVDGEETARVTVAVMDPLLQVLDFNVSYTYQPTTYIAGGGGRAIAGLIVLFFALTIAFVALEPTLRNKILDLKR